MIPSVGAAALYDIWLLGIIALGPGLSLLHRGQCVANMQQDMALQKSSMCHKRWQAATTVRSLCKLVGSAASDDAAFCNLASSPLDIILIWQNETFLHVCPLLVRPCPQFLCRWPYLHQVICRDITMAPVSRLETSCNLLSALCEMGHDLFYSLFLSMSLHPSLLCMFPCPALLCVCVCLYDAGR